MPPDLHAQIHEAVKENTRTFNAEIVARLQESFESPRLGFGSGSVVERLQQAKRELDEVVLVKQGGQKIAEQVTELFYREFLKRAAAEGLVALIQKPKT